MKMMQVLIAEDNNKIDYNGFLFYKKIKWNHVKKSKRPEWRRNNDST